MALFSLGQLKSWLPEAKIEASMEGSVENVVIDSREAGQGALFVALPGERVDGHEYVEGALSQGGVGAIVAHSWAENQEDADPRWIKVDSPLEALQASARGYLSQFPHLKKLALTGSNGKTTTKEMAGAILQKWAPGLYTPGNFNSDIGLPLTVFQIRKEHRWALFEMGMNRAGEISELVDIVDPQWALITNVWNAHVGMLGSKEAIAAEKKSIFSRFDGSQKAIVWDQDPFRDFLIKDLPGQVEFYGLESSRDFLGVKDLGLKGQILQFRQGEIHLPLWGRYNLLNALAAIALVTPLGPDWVHIKEGLEGLKPLFGRGEVEEGKITLVKDCYNANPDSMEESINALEGLEHQGRKILVLGDMGELGDQQSELHGRVWKAAENSGCDLIFTLGENFFSFNSVDELKFKNFEDLEKALLDRVVPGDLIWLKGSRVFALERLSEPLKNI